MVNVSLDHIRGSLSAGIDEATWTITSYLVSNAIIIPMTGWLSRLLGRKVYLMISVTLFTLSSLLCGLSWNLTEPRLSSVSSRASGEAACSRSPRQSFSNPSRSSR